MFSIPLRTGLIGAAVALLAAFPAVAQGAVLYDQTDAGGGTATVSDDYSDNNSLDDQLADDFTVPAGESWQISQVDVGGFTFSTPPPSVNVFLYSNAGTLPGGQIFGQLGIAATGAP